MLAKNIVQQNIETKKRIPTICLTCRNLKLNECKKSLEPKGKYGGGIQCKRWRPKVD